MQCVQRRSDGTRVLTEKLETKFIAVEEFELKGKCSCQRNRAWTATFKSRWHETNRPCIRIAPILKTKAPVA